MMVGTALFLAEKLFRSPIMGLIGLLTCNGLEIIYVGPTSYS